MTNQHDEREGAPERLIVCTDTSSGKPAIADWAKGDMKACDVEYVRADLAATRMRERCVDAVKAALADARRSWPASRATTEYELGARGAFTAALSAIESLTLEEEQTR